MAVTALNLLQPIGTHLPGLLAQSARANQARSEIWFYLLMLVLASCVIVVFGLIARKLLTSPIESGDAAAVIDLAELRRMHREGKLSDEEFQAARAAALMGSAALLTPASDTAEEDTDASDDPDSPPSPPPPDVTPEVAPDVAPEVPPQAPSSAPSSRDIELGPELLPPDDPRPPAE